MKIISMILLTYFSIGILVMIIFFIIARVRAKIRNYTLLQDLFFSSTMIYLWPIVIYVY